jgi:glycosyltransferase involved in cell wall biosynthesis
MRRLRLLHTESSCGWGGQELRVLAEAQGLRSRGHEVWVAAPAESRIFAEAMKREIPAAALPIARKGIAGIFSLRAFLADHRVEIVNTHSSTDAWLTALARCGLRDAPAMVRTRHISAPIPRNALSAWLYRRASALLVTTGEALRAQVVNETGVSPERVLSIPTGVDLEHFRPGNRAAARAALALPAEAFIVAIVATLRSWKGHEFLVDSVSRIPGVLLLIVGDGPGRDNLRKQVGDAGLGERVTFAGHQEDVLPWLHSADVVALPSYANEGVPQALMQAMACGIPVVTTAVGSIGEIVQDGVQGVMVPPKDSAALAGAIRTLQSDAALRSRLGAAGVAQARERFSMERMLDGMEAVFLRAAGAPG